MLQNPFLRPNGGEFYHFCHSFSFRNTDQEPVAGSPESCQEPALLQAVALGVGREWRRDGGPLLLHVSALLLRERRLGRWGPRICNTHVPSPLCRLRSSGTCSDTGQCPPRCSSPSTFADPPPAVSAGVLSPPFSSAVSTDFQISDTISSYFVCYLPC